MDAPDTAWEFDFSLSYTHTHPICLSHPYPRVTTEGRQRLDDIIEVGCRCKTHQVTTATLRRRKIRAAVSIWLQCDACGSAVGSSSMARKEHFNWQDYPEWADGLQRLYDYLDTEARNQRLAELDRSRAFDRELVFAQLGRSADKIAADKAQRSAEYAEWTATSPEWNYTRGRVLWRSRGICEACLTNPSVVVHHLTYSLGKLPPAWHLRAICHECHDRLHDGDDEWCIPGMER